ncbi:hypothetical protein T4D_12159 [Trichinella pseudospiralis]|uniref:Uncharacterized protein n=1 Tax=Trichinella pseudospiralis TaxID=6337 RepID=A0A0V1EM56_TRIPS|nr:hypothetical protein T4D_12159 [Trichinella pseudospiralis]
MLGRSGTRRTIFCRSAIQGRPNAIGCLTAQIKCKEQFKLWPCPWAKFCTRSFRDTPLPSFVLNYDPVRHRQVVFAN